MWCQMESQNADRQLQENKQLYNVDVDQERILIMPGGKPTMYYAISRAREIIHPTPAFPIYESMINYTGAKPVPYDLTEDKDLKFTAENSFFNNR